MPREKKMRRIDTLYLAPLLLALLAAGPATARIKCWTTDEGVRECGNVVPPKYAQKKRIEVNKQGVVVKELEEARSKEEIAAERERQRKLEEERKRQAEQARKDRILLETFSSEDDIVLTRDGKIAALESEIKLTRSRIDKLRDNLDQMIRAAAAQERAGKEPSAEVTRDIASLKRQIAENERHIQDKRAEQEAIRKEFQGYLERYRELRRQQTEGKEDTP
ncbi:MAG: hypothetical protein D6786_02850 [Gammaproteobacteria bacterium]|nr:MAG: hypothetical protein D6786_02850 [Gammaproteobacteria bacterium]